MKHFDITDYFDWEIEPGEPYKVWEEDSEGNEVLTRKADDYYRIKLNVSKLCKDYELDEQWVVENIFKVNGHRFHFSQAVLVDGWYVTTDIDEQEDWDSELIENEIMPGLQRYIVRLINAAHPA